MGIVKHNDLPFHLEQNKWTFVDSIEEADVIPVCRPPLYCDYYGQKSVFTHEDQYKVLREHASGKCILVMMQGV